MRFVIAFATLMAVGTATANELATPVSPVPDTQVAATCFKTGERSAGMNKICYYDCLGSPAAITIKSYQLCPLTIRD